LTKWHCFDVLLSCSRAFYGKSTKDSSN